jgi:outer membrane protein assembly factor BamB
MMPGMARLALAAVSALTLVACGSVAGPAATHAAVSTRSAPASGSCPPPPPRHAWAVDVTRTGRILWRTPLATRDDSLSGAVPPVTVGAVAVLAQDGAVHGVRLADGRPLWSWAGGQAVTADGGLAMAVIGQGLQVVNLADGHVRWRHRIPASSGLTAAGDVVIYALNGHLTGYDARTGGIRWAATPGVPPDPALQLAGGLVLITSRASGPSIPNTLTAVVPATGRVAWRFDPPAPATDPGAQASVLSAGAAGLAVATYDPRRLYLLGLRTGRPRWHAGTYVDQGTLPLVTGTSVVGVEGQARVVMVARDAATGRVRWRDSLPGPSDGYLPVLAAGTLAILPGEPAAPGATAPLRAYQTATGRLAWQAAMPAFVQAPPVLVPGGILVQAADTEYACAA